MAFQVEFIGRKRFDETTYVELYRRIYRFKSLYIIMFRDIETGVFVKRKPIYRQTYAVNAKKEQGLGIPIHGIYYSCIIHLHGSKELVDALKNEQERLYREWAERNLGYPKERWSATWLKAWERTSYSLVEFTTVAPEDRKEIFDEINTFHKLWEEEGVTVNEETEETGYI